MGRNLKKNNRNPEKIGTPILDFRSKIVSFTIGRPLLSGELGIVKLCPKIYSVRREFLF
jgi:hypothetical protein